MRRLCRSSFRFSLVAACLQRLTVLLRVRAHDKIKSVLFLCTRSYSIHESLPLSVKCRCVFVCGCRLHRRAAARDHTTHRNTVSSQIVQVSKKSNVLLYSSLCYCVSIFRVGNPFAPSAVATIRQQQQQHNTGIDSASGICVHVCVYAISYVYPYIVRHILNRSSSVPKRYNCLLCDIKAVTQLLLLWWYMYM